MDLEVQFTPKLSQVQLSIFLNSAKLGDRQMPEEHIWKTATMSWNHNFITSKRRKKKTAQT